ncbi:MAG: toll/interleukin-1 receptor domain-containing protein [Flavobacteriales bacterium]
MSIITRSQLGQIAQNRAGYKGLSGIVRENLQYSRASHTTSIFLSHAHTDKEMIAQAVTFFRTLGVSVYVDWMDHTMPEKPSGETALKIKSKIQINDKFVLLATNTAVASKWCNWEVGIADPYKLNNKKMALFPLADNNGTWNGNEYLQIYPRIENSPYHTNSFMIMYPNGTSENIENWLNK